MNKTAIKNFAVWARNKLISEIAYKASLVGISEKGISAPLPISTDNIQFFDIGTGKPTEIVNEEIKQRDALVSRIKDKEKTFDYKTAFQFVMEEVAYTWFNRLVAIRFMEVNEYLPSKIRVLSSVMQGKAEPDMVTTPFDTDMEFSAYETDRIMQLKDENKLDELFRMLFIKQCNKLNEVLPELFEKTNDYTEYLLNISFTDKDGMVSRLVNDIEEKDFTEAVEIIGWLYQYYNTEPKEQVFTNRKKNIKITKENIPAATQLFTPDWIVRYMVENSLGRLWVEGHENDSLKDKWNYYLDEAEQEESVNAELEKIRADYKNIKLEEIKLIDPCMGSGHILVYAFDVFMQIYESQGYTQRDAAQAIIKNNIYGLDIDERAYQLAYFALLMKARKYDRRFLTRGIAPQVYCPRGYADGEEYGSLLNVDSLEPKPLEPEELTLFNMDWKKNENTWNFRRLLHQKYDLVVTNPPYMGSKGMNVKLSDFVKKNYPDSKSDLFAVFIERCLQMTKQNAYTAMITQHAFMFLSSHEKLRRKLLHTDIINMAHLGERAFEEIGGEVVQTTSFVIRKSYTKNYKGVYARLVDYNSQQEKENAFLAKHTFHTAQQANFSKIPGSPIAYWVSGATLKNYKMSEPLGEMAHVKKGMFTGQNDLFFRLWHESCFSSIDFNVTSKENIVLNHYVPMNSGGSFRRWYGNRVNIIKFDNYHYNLISKNQGHRSPNLYFKRAASWTKITTGNFSIRLSEVGFINNDASMAVFEKEDKLEVIAGLLNSKVSQHYLSLVNESLNYTSGNVASIPYIKSIPEQVKTLVYNCISLSKTDWDSFETSWDFVRHPLLNYGVSMYSGLGDGANPPTSEIGVEKTETSYKIYEKNAPKSYTISSAFNMWETTCNDRFNQLKVNEEELNRIFIDIYGLQEELTPEVEDKDVTVRKADLTRDIKSFVSYAVGCMFGRYSLDVDGLAYAGGDWDDSKYRTFIPDADNVIPITDEEYFEDDIVGLFVAFVKRVYGEETLEETLDFIAKALGNKGSTAREVIRNYFTKDFYKDHVKTYQKRPIYWLYDSGKADGFKVLIYMHRYNGDTTGKVRVDYLHKMQRTYMSEMEHMQDVINNSANPREVAQAEKRKEKLIKQLKETKDYDEKIAHLALSRIAIDLDDGVKVNYEKVQIAQGDKKLDVLGKI